MVHTVPVFNIFSGRFDEKEIVWLGAVEGLDAARDRMLQFAAKEPGPFFVFDSQNHAVAASVDTSGSMRAPKSKANGDAYASLYLVPPWNTRLNLLRRVI